MSIENRKSVSEELRARHQKAREQGGDMMYYGEGDPLLVRAADEIDRLTAAKSGVGITDEMVEAAALAIASHFSAADRAYGEPKEAARAALTAAIGKMDGWQLVPINPPQDFLERFVRGGLNWRGEGEPGPEAGITRARERWHRFLAKAPTPTSDGGGK